MQNNRKALDTIVSKTKIYLAIIAGLLITICIKEPKCIIPSLFGYILIIIYTFWTNNKRKAEISKHIQELTINVDSAAKNTLINSPFPLVIIETDGNIIWKSYRFINEFNNIDILNILNEVVVEIKHEIESRENKKDKSIKKQLQIGKKHYEIVGEYVKSKQKGKQRYTEYMMILYFIENTEYLEAIQKQKDSEICVGILNIDNYEEISQRLAVEEKTQIMAKVEKSIYEWATLTNGVVVKSDRDTFVYIFEQKYLEQIKDSKFEILDTVKEFNMKGALQITLSIAISNEGETNYERYKSALAAMDIALGRGGDQAVIREGGKYSFFGGRTIELEKRTKVKARIVANALEELIQEASDVMIMGHTNGDIDSIGASLGIYRLAKTLEKPAYIVNNTFGASLSSFMESIKDEEEYKDLFLSKNEAIDKVTPSTLLIVVDTNKNNYVEVPELLETVSKVVVIDHHRRSAEYIDDAVLTFHEVYASSASELVTELIQYASKDVTLSTIEAESLYAGIMVDTKNFTFKTGVRTFEAAAYLRKCSIDIIRVKKWFQSDLESYNMIAEIVRNTEVYNESIAISVYDKKDKDAGLICAKAADELLTISDITASFVIGKLGDKVCISGRSIGDINVQIILEKLRRRRTYYFSRSTSRRNDNSRS